MESDNVTFPHKRRYVRKDVDAMVAVFSRGEYTFEMASQISEGGMLLEVARTLIMGDEVQVTFYFNGLEYPPCSGRVVYHLRNQKGQRLVGLRFESLAEPLRKRIRAYTDQ